MRGRTQVDVHKCLASTGSLGYRLLASRFPYFGKFACCCDKAQFQNSALCDLTEATDWSERAGVAPRNKHCVYIQGLHPSKCTFEGWSRLNAEQSTVSIHRK